MTKSDPTGVSSSASRRAGIVTIGAVAFASSVIAVLVATLTIAMTRPSDHELQRAAAEELGLPMALFEVPGVQTLTDDVTDRVAGRVVDESKPSLSLGLAVGMLSGGLAAATATAVLAHRRPWQPVQRTEREGAHSGDGR